VVQPLQLCHYKKFFFLLDRLSATDGQLNNVLQLSMIFCDFVQNIFKKHCLLQSIYKLCSTEAKNDNAITSTMLFWLYLKAE